MENSNDSIEIDRDYTAVLRSHMQRQSIPSFRALSQQAGVSRWQIQQLRRGQAATMRVQVLVQLSQVLQVALPELIAQFSDLTLADEGEAVVSATQERSRQLEREYARLQSQLEAQQQTLEQQFQQASLQTLESWMLQWPTAANAAQNNPQAPAVKLLPLVRPIEQLLKNWGVVAISTVGAEVPYDPQIHQLMGGTAQSGEVVKVRYTGYFQDDKLLYRAKVSPLSDS